MEYLYEISINTADRRIRATYVEDPDDLAATDFQTLSFTPQDLDAEILEGFTLSRLETLVLLFTGEDPAKTLKAQDTQCSHEDSDDCDCPMASIPIPAILAYHAISLSQDLGNLGSWNTQESYSVFHSRRQAAVKILNRWYQQGILLHQASR